MTRYKVIGIMSGTSLDGLDIAYCEFEKKKTWRYKIVQAETIKYTKKWKRVLNNAFSMEKKELRKLDKEYGKFIGNKILKFSSKNRVKADFISSHGHTVFHRPAIKLTLQIGNGGEIASVCKLPVICDFRSGDVALGGEGAPLVPVVDKILFTHYDFCLNLGGFANISFDNVQNERIAFDICPVNIVLNGLANKLGKEFDRGGKMASRGKIYNSLLKKLNAISFYKASPPKSLGREWVESRFLPILHSVDIPLKHKLRTVIEHAAIQISSAVNRQSLIRTPKLLITGGGAYNTLLVERIAFHSKCKITLPDSPTIQFKEAMAFAFLGVLKKRNEINILKSVTGAKRSSSGGKIYSA